MKQIAILLLVFLAQTGDDPAVPTLAEEQSARFLDFYKKEAAKYQMHVGDQGNLKFNPNPVFRFASPIDNNFNGTLFVWTREVSSIYIASGNRAVNNLIESAEGEHPVRSALLLALACAALCYAGTFVGYADEAANKKVDDLTARRNELMQNRIATVKVSSEEAGFPKALNTKPIFRYTDPARNYVAAAVWKLGETGRPKAIVTTELHRQFFGRRIISYEYLSLTATEFAATSDDVRWLPGDSVLKFKAVPGAPVPDKSRQRRLLQLRAIAKRFEGEEIVENENCALRLLPQPVDRYTPSAADRADGAIFLLCYGTNPEILLCIESDGKAWSYAAGRLTGAEQVKLTIDGTTAWEGPQFKYGFNQPYDSSNSPADIPGVAPDGSEIKE